MADIAAEAGMSPGAIYRYFASKEDVIKASGQERSEVRAALFKDLSEKHDTLQALALIVDGYMARFDGADPELALFVQLFGEGQSNPAVRESILARWDASISSTAELIRRGQAQGEINPALDPRALGLLFVAAIGGLMVHKSLDPGVDVWQFGEALKLLLRGDFWRGASRPADGDGQHPVVGLHSQTREGSYGSPTLSGQSRPD
jgi:AcrR family transcriptional regulator